MPDRDGPEAESRQHTVLHIADALAHLDLVEAALTRLGDVRVIGALQGRLGLALALAHRPRLILLALDLPDLPGSDVLQHLRADPRTQVIPVLTHGESGSHGLHLFGTVGHLTLPEQIGQLPALVSRLLA